jgi:hypothetical protein
LFSTEKTVVYSSPDGSGILFSLWTEVLEAHKLKRYSVQRDKTPLKYKISAPKNNRNYFEKSIAILVLLYLEKF